MSESLSPQENEQLLTYERIIEKGLQTFIEVGAALLEIKSLRLYRASHNSFEHYCQQRWNMSIRHSERLMNACRVLTNLEKSDQLVAFPTAEYQLRPLAGLSPELQQQVWQEVSNNPEKITGALVQEKVAQLQPQTTTQKNTSLDIHYSSKSDEWYTPKKIIDAVLAMWSVIDLDPCSNSLEHPNVLAKQHFTKEVNGLNQAWHGKVYLNPPFGYEVKAWIEKLHRHFEDGEISQAIALVPARTDTKWFAILRTYPRCFIRGKLHFNDSEFPAPFPSVAVYLGNELDSFKQAFSKLGDIYILSK